MQNNDTSPKKKKRRGLRPDGLIQVTLDLGFDENGKRKRKSFYGKTRAEAEAKRDEYKDSLRHGCKYNPNITVAEWVKIYLQTYCNNYNKLYKQLHDSYYIRIVELFGEYRISDVTEVILQQGLNQYAGMSFSYVDKLKCAIKAVFTKAQVNHIIVTNPSIDLKLPQYTKGTHRVLEEWELEWTKNHWMDFRGGVWIMLMLFAGLRRGEMIALTWDNVNMDERSISIVQTATCVSNHVYIEQRAKSKAGIRSIPISKPLYDALNSIDISDRKGYVNVSMHRHNILTPSTIEQCMKRYNTKLKEYANSHAISLINRRDVRCHDLRHTFCTMLYNAGVDMYTASQLLGHANINITMEIYTHLTESKKEKSKAKLLEYMDNM